jgi:hypothetical protein
MMLTHSKSFDLHGHRPEAEDLRFIIKQAEACTTHVTALKHHF